MDVTPPPDPQGAAGPDLSPRTTTDLAAPPRRRRKGWGAAALLALVLVAGGVLLYQGLSSATVYFCNADEVGRRSECSGTSRFRLQGTVDQGSKQEEAGQLRFTVSYGGATIPVTYQGDPGGIFREGIPVVVEGRLVGSEAGAVTPGQPGVSFAGDRILVKHTEQYVEENPGRVPEGAP